MQKVQNGHVNSHGKKHIIPPKAREKDDHKQNTETIEPGQDNLNTNRG